MTEESAPAVAPLPVETQEVAPAPAVSEPEPAAPAEPAPAPIEEAPPPADTVIPPALAEAAPAPPAPEEEAPAPRQPRGPRMGDLVEYRGYESGGSHEHPAIVTGVNDDGSVDLTVFFRRSAPAALVGAIEGDDGYFAVPPQE